MKSIFKLAKSKSKKKIEEAKELILNNPNIVSVLNKLKDTPLHVATRSGVIEVVELFIKKGANVNSVGNFEATPLDLASQKGFLAKVKLLIARGAKITAYALRAAVENDEFEIVNHLIKNGAKINNEALDAAQYMQYFDITKLLVANGGWLNILNAIKTDDQLRRIRTAYLAIAPILDLHKCDDYYEIYNQLRNCSDLKNLLTTSKTMIGLTQISLGNSLESMPENIKEHIFTFLANDKKVSRIIINRIEQLQDNKIDLYNIDINKICKEGERINFLHQEDDLKYLSTPLAKIKLAYIMQMSPNAFDDFIKQNTHQNINKSQIEYLLNNDKNQVKRKWVEIVKLEDAPSKVAQNNNRKKSKIEKGVFL